MITVLEFIVNVLFSVQSIIVALNTFLNRYFIVIYLKKMTHFLCRHFCKVLMTSLKIVLFS